MEIQINNPDTLGFNIGSIGGGAVNSVNGKIGNVVLNYEDVGALSENTELFSGDYNDLTNKPTIPTVPTNVSAFTNDAGYLTEHQDISGKAGLDYVNMQDQLLENAIQGVATDLSGDIATLNTTKADKSEIPTVPTNVSAFTNDTGYLTQHQSLDGYATEDWVENKGYLTQHQDISGKQDKLTAGTNISIVDNVISATGSGGTFNYTDLTNKPKINNVELSGNKTTSDLGLFSGNYNDLSNKPTIPTVPTNISAFTNDAGYLTSHQDISGKADITYVDTQDNAIISALNTAKEEFTEELEEKASIDYVDNQLTHKQDTLTAGTNISIVNNVISATGSSGNGIFWCDNSTTYDEVTQAIADGKEVIYKDNYNFYFRYVSKSVGTY